MVGPLVLNMDQFNMESHSQGQQDSVAEYLMTGIFLANMVKDDMMVPKQEQWAEPMVGSGVDLFTSYIEVKEEQETLKVKQETDLSPSMALTDTNKPLVILRKKRVFMANLDPHELSCDICHKSF
eukprot:GFUD01102328.1.p1 GENE.GFUD01102328.1~~GFUD01102328.1.p1  ORF type:complete len:140 (+),score=17.62 GFUD01102328.1:47-421(+)